MYFFSSAADTVSGAYGFTQRRLSVCLCVGLSTIYLNRYSSNSSHSISTKPGTKLEHMEGQKMLGAEFSIFLPLGGKKQTTLLFFVNLFKSLHLQFLTNFNQTWRRVTTHGAAKNVASRILNFCLFGGKKQTTLPFLSIFQIATPPTVLNLSYSNMT